eukprot:CAMPEP_0179439720 /NCGR_PEP_ID=MMETSP0799-20121207/23338_1 /TAXON_ID=46947 /ORGANISM="Geminigera cryophila, Strain CCMP2564" /LENGTH=156 /DNA_ID=CAMNT_0021222389 /DNA_START=87 /DNA_END=557 /DNA_ORIENTATION=+
MGVFNQVGEAVHTLKSDIKTLANLPPSLAPLPPSTLQPLPNNTLPTLTPPPPPPQHQLPPQQHAHAHAHAHAQTQQQQQPHPQTPQQVQQPMPEGTTASEPTHNATTHCNNTMQQDSATTASEPRHTADPLHATAHPRQDSLFPPLPARQCTPRCT